MCVHRRNREQGESKMRFQVTTSNCLICTGFYRKIGLPIRFRILCKFLKKKKSRINHFLFWAFLAANRILYSFKIESTLVFDILS